MGLLHSTIYGEGSPLLILHGFLGMSDNWKTLGKKYAENGFEVHLIDLRNHGRSFWSDEFSYELLAADLIPYMEAHKIEKAHVIGHSMGGKTAMELAVTYPQNVQSLIVVDISPRYYPPHHDEIIFALKQLPFGTLNSRSDAEHILSQYLKDAGVRQFLLKNLYWVDKEKLGFRANLEVLSESLEEIGAPIKGTGTYAGPTLFVKGDRSEYISPQDEGIIKRHFPKAQLETVTNSGHWVHAENPTEFFNISLQFLLHSKGEDIMRA